MELSTARVMLAQRTIERKAQIARLHSQGVGLDATANYAAVNPAEVERLAKRVERLELVTAELETMAACEHRRERLECNERLVDMILERAGSGVG